VTDPILEIQMPSVPDNPWVGLDIGGANLKAAHSSGWSNSCIFPMWKQWQTLAVSVAKLLDECPAFSGVAVTMTGELADCFATRAEGVAVILEQLTSVLPASLVRVYSVEGKWLSVSQAARDPWKVAASNWHGLARYVTRIVGKKSCLLIDVGSTTTDIIPIHDEKILIEDRTDSQRLQSGALVYTGVERSNIAGIVRELTLFNSVCPVMNEQFATTRDVYLWLREIEDDPTNCETADNQPATRKAARYRLARLVGEDGSTLTDSDIDVIATQVFHAQTSMVAKGVERVLKMAAASHAKCNKKTATRSKELTSQRSLSSTCVVLSGHGDFLIEAAVGSLGGAGEYIRLKSSIGETLSRCAPAYAIAVLASEELETHLRPNA
jgi:(4-(4-[2-(gamma-L-glutamylamino)ethyl]phenoxymethyl)furan-2-yl)methanamine synthase